MNLMNTNNQKMYGGANKKQGLPRTVGLGQYSNRIIQLRGGYCRCIPRALSGTTIPATSTPYVY